MRRPATTRSGCGTRWRCATNAWRSCHTIPPGLRAAKRSARANCNGSTIDAPTRMALLKNLRAISRKLHEATAGGKGEDVAEATEEERKKKSEQARKAARQQGLLALAVLGKRLCDDSAQAAGRLSEKY